MIRKVIFKRFGLVVLTVISVFILLNNMPILNAGNTVDDAWGYQNANYQESLWHQGELRLTRQARNQAEAEHIALQYNLELETYSPYGFAVFIANQPYDYYKALENTMFYEYGIYRTFDVVPNDPELNEQYSLEMIQAFEAWSLSKGEGILIAVIDTGIDIHHEEFVGRISPLSYNAVTKQVGLEHVIDDEGHGTMVAGVIAANQDNNVGISGIAPLSELLVVKANIPGLGQFRHEVIAEAIEYSVAQGAQIINLSLGGPFASPAMEEALEHARSQGVIVVASSGNYNSTFPVYPAFFASTISVGAVNENRERASFSSYNRNVDVTAPGDNIYTTMLDNNYGSISGTSFSAPYVAGTIALLLDYFDDASMDDIFNRLFLTSEDLGPFGKDIFYGHGLIQAYDALSLPFHTVSFETFAGTSVDPIHVPEGMPFRIYQRTSLENHYFNRWYKDEALTIPWVPRDSVIYEDITLYAEFIEGEGMGSDDLLYTIDNGEVIIDGYTGIDDYVVLPSQIENLPVTRVSPYALIGNDSITELIIPNTIEWIGDGAFSEMLSIEHIEIGENVNHLGFGVFSNNPTLTSVVFNGDKITELPVESFAFATGLVSIELPEKLETIRYAAFISNYSLNHIDLPSTLKTIDSEAFFYAGLNQLILPDSVESIGVQSFERNFNMDYLYMGESLRYIGESALFMNRNLVTIEIAEGNPYFVIEEDVIFSKDKQELVYYSPLKQAQHYVIPETVTTIHDGAFSHARFETIEFNDVLTHIPNRAFYLAKNLRTVELPENITSAGFQAFARIYSLTSFTFSADFEVIPYEMFRETYSLKEVVFSDNVHTIEAQAFAQSGLEEIILPDTILTMGEWVFTSSVLLRSVTLPRHLEVLPNHTFAFTHLMQELVFPEALTHINSTALNLDSLYSFTVPDTVEHMGYHEIGMYWLNGIPSLLRYLDFNRVRDVHLILLNSPNLEYLVIGEEAETFNIHGALMNNDLHIYIHSEELEFQTLGFQTHNQHRVIFYTDYPSQLEAKLETADFDYEIRALSSETEFDVSIHIEGPATMNESVPNTVQQYELLQFTLDVEEGYMVYSVKVNGNLVPNFNRQYFQHAYEDIVFDIVIKPIDYVLDYENIEIFNQGIFTIATNAEVINLPHYTETGLPIIEYGDYELSYQQSFANGEFRWRSHSEYVRELHLPKYIEELRSFWGYVSLERLTLPTHLNTMQGIKGNTAMQELLIPASFKNLTIGDFWEQNDVYLDNLYALERLIFEGESLVRLNESALRDLYSLRTLELPYSLISIDRFALENAISLEEIILNNPNTTIADEAFSIYGVGGLFDFWLIPIPELEVQRNPFITLKSAPNAFAIEYADQHGYPFEALTEFTVKFLGFDGTVVHEETVAYLEDATALVLDNVLTDSGYEYTFIGWHAPTERIDGNRVFMPIFESTLVAHTVLFKDIDGNVLKTEILDPGVDATAPEMQNYVFTSEGVNVFSGWDQPFNNVEEDLIILPVYQFKPFDTVFGLEPGVDTVYQYDLWQDAGFFSLLDQVGYHLVGDVNTHEVGITKLTYLLTFDEEVVYSLDRFVTIVERPQSIEIILLPSIDTIALNGEYLEAGAESTMGEVETSGTVNTSVAGVYEIVYRVTYQGQITTATRYVTVLENFQTRVSMNKVIAHIEPRKEEELYQ